ncbi:MAG TPA: DegT/DnrJ/EryC1/StrS family aminotransferase [Anaerolineae bacterium]|nr:DegT/DnrJ/EryC1/StrS family aminotransferase [Anaerolineae bacterium]
MIPKSRPYLGVRELLALLDWRADRRQFEAAVAALAGARFGLAFGFAHAAFYALLKTLNLKQAEIILPAYTCDIMADVILRTDNIPVFVDIDLADFNMDLAALKKAITSRTRVVVATHMFGYPMDVRALRQVVDSDRILIVEDSALRLSSSARLCGDVGLFSFGPGKPVFTIRGGVCVTNDPNLYEQLRQYRAAQMKRVPPKEWAKRWARLMVTCLSQSDAGYGLALRLGLADGSFERSATAMSDSSTTAYADFQARLGLALLRKADALVARRRMLADLYRRELNYLHGFVPAPLVEGADYSYYSARIRHRDDLRVSQRMYERGIQTGRTFDYAVPNFARYRPYLRAGFPRAEQAALEVVNLPIHANLTEARARFIANQLREILLENGRESVSRANASRVEGTTGIFDETRAGGHPHWEANGRSRTGVLSFPTVFQRIRKSGSASRTMDMDEISVLIPDGENEHVLWVARSLANSGRVRLHVLSNKRWTPVRLSRHCAYEFRPIGTDYAARVAALSDMTHREHIDVILPVSEEGVLFAAAKRDALSGLAALPPIPTLEALNIARNKWQLNQFASQHSLPVPEALAVTLDAEFDRRLSELEYPVLLKPAALTDGQGIRRFEMPSELRAFLADQDEQRFKDNYLVQTFVPGSDVGLSVLCRAGEVLAYTIQRGLISAAHRFGPLTAMEFIPQADVLEIGHKLLAALRWSGVAHIDFRLDNRDGRAKIIEMNARYWGSLLGSLVAGVNFPYRACLTALGLPGSTPEYQHSRFTYSTTAIKECLRRLRGKSLLNGLAFHETGLRFFVADPFPELVKKLQDWGRLQS